MYINILLGFQHNFLKITFSSSRLYAFLADNVEIFPSNGNMSSYSISSPVVPKVLSTGNRVFRKES